MGKTRKSDEFIFFFVFFPANYAEHWCSLLRNPNGPFAECHLAIDPSEYYKVL